MAKILYLEDEEEMRFLVSMMMRRAGHEVTEVTNVAQARTAFAAGSFDMIVTDYELPDGFGLDFARGVRKDGHNLPVLVMTSLVKEDLHKDNIDYDELAVRYLNKKDMPDKLKSMIAVMLETAGISQNREGGYDGGL